jgi:hypothetical protein
MMMMRKLCKLLRLARTAYAARGNHRLGQLQLQMKHHSFCSRSRILEVLDVLLCLKQLQFEVFCTFEPALTCKAARDDAS